MAKILAMPSLSPSMEQGLLQSWNKALGAFIESGEVLALIETDKAVVEYEILEDGYLLHFFLQPGQSTPVGQPIAILAESPQESISALIQSASTPLPVASKPSIQPAEEVQARAVSSERDQVVPNIPPMIPKTSDFFPGIKVSPLARRFAAEKKIDLQQVRGSGPGGRVVKGDVEKALLRMSVGSKQGIPVVKLPVSIGTLPILGNEGPYQLIPLTGMRKAIATRLVESVQTIPHFFLTSKIQTDSLSALRQELNESSDIKFSFNDLIIKACGNALIQHPMVNSRYTSEGILQFLHAHIGFAVATPEGLITPIVRNVDEKGLRQISIEAKELAGRAREKRLSLEEFTGGTFGTSNLGMYGIESFTAIINPPQACNLAIAQISTELRKQQGEVVEVSVMNLTLSCDHRVVDGAVGSAFLKTLKDLLEHPVRFLI